MPADLGALLADLADETAALTALTAPLDDAGWRQPTPAPGWTIADQIGHLAYFDETVVMAATDPAEFIAYRAQIEAAGGIDTEVIAARYRDWGAADLRDWFAAARTRLLSVFAGLDPALRVPWFGPAMSLPSAVTARLMETWAHGHDVATALETRRPPTSRLVHVATLGYLTRAWSYRVRGEPVPEGAVAVELEGPHDNAWRFGPTQVDDVVSGDAEEFCLVVTQRRHVDDTHLRCGELARDWLLKAQAFAGGPSNGPRATA